MVQTKSLPCQSARISSATAAFEHSCWIAVHGREISGDQVDSDIFLVDGLEPKRLS